MEHKIIVQIAKVVLEMVKFFFMVSIVSAHLELLSTRCKVNTRLKKM